MPAKINPKTKGDLNKMIEGGKKLAAVKGALVKMIGVGVNAHEIEEEANKLIKSYGGKASFKMVCSSMSKEIHWPFSVLATYKVPFFKLLGSLPMNL